MMGSELGSVHVKLEQTGGLVSHDDRLTNQELCWLLTQEAKVAAETLRKGFPAQATLATVERIAKMVNDHLPGVPLQPLAVVPRQIPFHAGFVYFELERSDARFRELKGGGGIAIHVPEGFPGLSMELWAIRG